MATSWIEKLEALQTDLDNATDGLGALKTEIDANETKIDTVDTVVDGIQTDLDNGTDGLGALKTLIDAIPTASEIQTEMEQDGASLLDTLRDDLDNVTDGLGALKAIMDTSGVLANARSTAYTRLVGVTQIVATTIDLNQAAATYDLLTGTSQVVILESLNIKMPTGNAGGSITSISIQTDDVTAGVIIDSTDGAVANLTSEADLGWTGSLYITVATKIRLTIAGGAHGSSYVCNVTAKCRAVVDGGYLA